jgi:hypothetical protein
VEPTFDALIAPRAELQLKAIGTAIEREMTSVAEFLRRRLRGIVKARLGAITTAAPLLSAHIAAANRGMITTLSVAHHDDDKRNTPNGAPPLPLEGHRIATARALEAARLHCEQALLCIQYTPRDERTVFESINALNASVSDAWHAYVAFVQVLLCKGQA